MTEHAWHEQREHTLGLETSIAWREHRALTLGLAWDFLSLELKTACEESFRSGYRTGREHEPSHYFRPDLERHLQPTQ